MGLVAQLARAFVWAGVLFGHMIILWPILAFIAAGNDCGMAIKEIGGGGE